MASPRRGQLDVIGRCIELVASFLNFFLGPRFRGLLEVLVGQRLIRAREGAAKFLSRSDGAFFHPLREPFQLPD
jgi:hypothetical protein